MSTHEGLVLKRFISLLGRVVLFGVEGLVTSRSLAHTLEAANVLSSLSEVKVKLSFFCAVSCAHAKFVPITD